MPGGEVTERSYEKITAQDLEWLAKLAKAVFDELVGRSDAKSRIYKGRLLLIALCQGGGLHFVNGTTGIKDLDVWGFFRAHPVRPFPARAHWVRDFGPSHLGRNPNPPRRHRHCKGRAVDIIGRSIDVAPGEDGVAAVQRWLEAGRSKSASLLAQKAVVVIHPPELLGKVIWGDQNDGLGV
jgi:hypothetical protein